MAHAFRRRADGTLACRLDGEEKAIIAQVAQETADLIREIGRASCRERV